MNDEEPSISQPSQLLEIVVAVLDAASFEINRGPAPTPVKLPISTDLLSELARTAIGQSLERKGSATPSVSPIEAPRPVSPIEAPRRRHRLLIDVQGDTPQDLLDALRQATDSAEEKGETCSLMEVVTGGPRAGWTAIGEFRTDVTHESYFEAIAKWKEARS